MADVRTEYDMGRCKGCGKQIMTWWGPRCWVCTAAHLDEYAEKIAVAAEARALGQKLREGKPKSFRKGVG